MLYYYQANNFGDDLNPWLWPRLAPELVEERSDRLFLGIGTILNRKIPAGPRKFVFGTGWDGERPVRMGPEWRIHGVRGPLTAAGLGLPAETALSDPGLLVRRFVKRPPGATGRGVAFMPHHCSVGAVEWKPLCEARGLAYIDPEQPVDKVLPAIDGCRVLLAEAMHGAIVADALGVPWIPVRISGRINEFKWRDWCSSLGLTCRPVRLPPLHARLPTGMAGLRRRWKRTLAPTPLGKEKWKQLPERASTADEIERGMDSLAALPPRCDPQLSDRSRLDEAEARQLESLERLRREWREMP